MKKKLIFTFLLFFVLFLFSKILYKNEYYYYEKEKYNLFSMHKIIIIGDSRMSEINLHREELNIPNNYIFVALSGSRIKWLKEAALNKTYNLLKEKDNRYNYSVVFNLGVNDLNDNIDIYEISKEYYSKYKNLISYFDDVNFYFLSVNPIDDKINEYWENIRTNEKIEEFNNYTLNFIKEDNLKNVYFCDSYNELKFNTYDGLHYMKDTNINIINYINNNCIKTFHK